MRYSLLAFFSSMLSNTCLAMPQAVNADRPAAVVGQMDHDLVDLVLADADVERAADVNLEFRVTAQHGQGGPMVIIERS